MCGERVGDGRRQVSADVLLVKLVQLAIAEIGFYPAIDPVLQRGLVFAHADAELDLLEHEFLFEVQARGFFVHQLDHLRVLRNDFQLAAGDGSQRRGFVVEAYDAGRRGRHFGELDVIGRAAGRGNAQAGQVLRPGDMHGPGRRDDIQHRGIGQGKIYHLGSVGRVGQGGNDDIGPTGHQEWDAAGAGRRHDFELHPEVLGQQLRDMHVKTGRFQLRRLESERRVAQIDGHFDGLALLDAGQGVGAGRRTGGGYRGYRAKRQDVLFHEGLQVIDVFAAAMAILRYPGSCLKDDNVNVSGAQLTRLVVFPGFSGLQAEAGCRRHLARTY